jgi:MFS family permease
MLIFGDALGRRKGIIIGAAVMILGALIQVISFKGHNATAQFIIGRVVTGFGNGMNTATIPTYQAECSKTKNHGLLICIEGGIIAFGSLIAYWIDYGCSYGSDQFSWRFPIAFQSVFAIILLLGMIWLPESPRWLLTKDRHEDAAEVIAALRGHAVDDEETRFEAHIIMDSIRASGHTGGNTPFSALFTNGKTQHFRRMMLGASSQLMQQIGGCNAVIYYFPLLFENSIGATHDLSLLLGGVNMIVYATFATTSVSIDVQTMCGTFTDLWSGSGSSLRELVVESYSSLARSDKVFPWSSCSQPLSQAQKVQQKALQSASSLTLLSSLPRGYHYRGCILQK